MVPGRRVASALVVLPILLSVLPDVEAQGGRLEVTVYGGGGQRLPDATVTLTNAMKRVPPSTVRTDATGVAVFPVLPPGGGYVVGVSSGGYARQEIGGIRVRLNEPTRVAVRMSPELVERVVLEGKRDTVDLAKPSISTKFGSEFIEDLPSKGRLYQNLLTLAPGVQDADGDGNPNVHGARFRDFKALVSGVSNQDPLTGEWMNRINPDSIEEVEVVTAGAGVEFGRAQGGFANIVQKQGSNDLEGVFGFLWQSSLMDGNAAVSTPGVPAPKYDLIQPSVQISGPLIRDHLWYRFSHEYVRREDPVNTTRAVEIVTRKQSINADQITWQVSPRNKLALQFQSDPATVDNSGVSAITSSQSSTRIESGGPQYLLTWTAPVSARLLVDSLVSYQDAHLNKLPSEPGLTNECVNDFVLYAYYWKFYPLDYLADAQCTDLSRGRTSGQYFLTWRDKRQRLTVKSQASFYAGRFLGMTHQFKGGIAVENERYSRFLERRPDVTLQVDDVPVRQSDGRDKLYQQGTITARFAVPRTSFARSTGSNVAVFLEDQARPLSNLTLTLGVRLDRESIVSPGYETFDPAAEAARFLALAEPLTPDQRSLVAGKAFTGYERVYDLLVELARQMQIEPEWLGNVLGPVVSQSQSWEHIRRPADINTDRVNVAPRVSVAWDPWSDGKTKVAFSAGRYYDKIFLAVPQIEQEPATMTFVMRGLRLPGEREFKMDQWLPTGMTPPNAQIVDRNLRTPYVDELTFSVEREILPETSLRLSYIRRRFKDQLQNVDLNHYPYDYGRCSVPSPPTYATLLPEPDGVLDDCDGGTRVISVPDPVYPWIIVEKAFPAPDGYPDLYVYNPGWGYIYQVGNYNTAKYDAFVVEIVRRLYRNWQMEGSYAYSEAVGDAEDFSSFLGDDRTTLESERGYLSYDQRHVLKLNATTITPWGFRLGGTVVWESGLPYSILRAGTTYDSVPPQYEGLGSSQPHYRLRYVTGTRNDQRNRSAWTLNLRVDREANLRGRVNLRVSAEIFNLLNDKRYVIYNPALGYGQQLNGINEAYVTPGRTYQLGLRLAF